MRPSDHDPHLLVSRHRLAGLPGPTALHHLDEIRDPIAVGVGIGRIRQRHPLDGVREEVVVYVVEERLFSG